MVKLTIVFNSPFTQADRLVLYDETLEACKNRYFNWCKNYDIDKEEAISRVIYAEEEKIKD
jgi:hypothetical protein